MHLPATPSARDPEENLTSLITVQAHPDGGLSSVPMGGNVNGRVFGGQLLSQVLSAAAHGVTGRAATSLQLQFLRGALLGEPIDFQVETLQQGQRFLSRHVRAIQGGRGIAAATVCFQVASDSPTHQATMPTDLPPPEEVPTLDDLDAHIARTSTGGPYHLQQKRSLDLRLIDAIPLLYEPNAQARLRYWVKARHPLADDPLLHAAALAYLSDTWLGFASLSPHVPIVGSREQWYMASLNHAMWFHLPCRADEWLLFDVDGLRSGGGRSLSQARVFTRDGRMVASVAQELAVSPREG